MREHCLKSQVSLIIPWHANKTKLYDSNNTSSHTLYAYMYVTHLRNFIYLFVVDLIHSLLINTRHLILNDLRWDVLEEHTIIRLCWTMSRIWESASKISWQNDTVSSYHKCKCNDQPNSKQPESYTDKISFLVRSGHVEFQSNEENWNCCWTQLLIEIKWNVCDWGVNSIEITDPLFYADVFSTIRHVIEKKF